jgi:hypothetical protein
MMNLGLLALAYLQDLPRFTRARCESGGSHGHASGRQAGAGGLSFGLTAVLLRCMAQDLHA